MEHVDDKDKLKGMLDNSDGCVIYGAGLVGACIVQYLAKEKMMSKIICIAVKSMEKNPVSILGIPVCELGELESYKERYLFLIATLEHLQESIVNELIEYGCTQIVGITNRYYANIREETYDFSPDILCAVQKGLGNLYANFMNVFNKIDELGNELRSELRGELTYLIEEQNEITDINTKAFAQYQNCHRGKEVVIVATGPTLNDYQPIDGAVHIGVNIAYKEPNIHLDYLFVQDGRPEFMEKGKFIGIENVACQVFMGRVSKGMDVEYIEFPEEYRLHNNVRDFMVAQAWPQAGIYRDICHHPVYGGLTVTMSAFHFALFTYPRKIYLVGCDNVPTGYFDGTDDTNFIIDKERADNLKKDYEAMREFAHIHYPETEIISINPVGLKGVFKDVYTK